MKKLLYLLPVLLIMLASCSKNQSEILDTVPSDTNWVAMVDLKALVSDLAKGGHADLESAISSVTNVSGIDAKWRFMLSEDSGADFSGPLVAFEYQRASVVSFYVKDAGKFRNGMEQTIGAPLQEEDGILAGDDNTVFMKGDQVWLATEYPEVSPADIMTLSRLPEDKSIASSPLADMLTHGDNISLVVNLNNFLAFERRSQMLKNLLFDDAAYMVSYVNFEKEKFISETSILNSKCKPAPLSLSLSEIDVPALKSYTGRGNVFLAAGLDGKALSGLLGSFANAGMPSDMVGVIGSLDGNAVVSADFDSEFSSSSSFGLLLTFANGEVAAQASQVVGILLGNGDFNAEIDIEGNVCSVISGPQTGTSASEIASYFKDACIGLAIMPSAFEAWGIEDLADSIEACVLTVTSDQGSATIKTRVNTKGSANSLVAFLNLASRI